MSELKIDEKELALLGEHAKDFVDGLKDELACMLDTDADIFKRYMSYFRLSGLVLTAQNYYRVSKHCFHLGHDLNHPVFDTPERTEHNWDTVYIDKNPFFKQPDKISEHMRGEIVEVKEEDMTPCLKRQIEKLLVRQFKRKTQH